MNFIQSCETFEKSNAVAVVVSKNVSLVSIVVVVESQFTFLNNYKSDVVKTTMQHFFPEKMIQKTLPLSRYLL